MSEAAFLAAAATLASALAQTSAYLCQRYVRAASSSAPLPDSAQPTRSPLEVALSYEACTSGDLIEVVATPHTDRACRPRTRDGGASPLLAIQIDGKRAAVCLHAYLVKCTAHLRRQEGAEARCWNTILRPAHTAATAGDAFGAQERPCTDGTNSEVSPRSPSPTIVVSRRLLAASRAAPPSHLCSTVEHEVSSSVLCLAALLLPSAYDVWNTLREDVQRAAASARLAPSSSLDAAFWDTWCTVWLLTSLVVSHRYKLQEVWHVRAWLARVACEHRPPHTPVLDVSLFREDPVFFFAAAAHTMNYNAWHYRRQCWRACRLSYADDGYDVDVAEVFRECTRVQAFVDVHNSDSSATSYLLFLLHTLADVAQSTMSPGTREKVMTSVHDLWRQLMRFTQRVIRRYAEKGHECLWTLRLGLIEAVVGRGLHHIERGVPCGWTLEDELTWVSVYVDGFSSTSAGLVRARGGCDEGDDDEGTRAPLLAPVAGATANQVWGAALTGAYAYQSYMAARYGVQLIRLIGVHPKLRDVEGERKHTSGCGVLPSQS